MAELGELVRTAREVKGRSPVDVSKDADISTAYLNKLERNAVANPSPHVLFRLARALDVPYEELMRAAGYVLPGESQTGKRRKTLAFYAEDLSPEEIEELERYLAWYRERKKRA